ncbi:MAG: RNA polymerase sigma factor [Anaerolineae bacterium]|nr:RNA polymerase sigma factor [Anaerolineae bacterium]MCI0607774.1 RNA polymerase sigma factor [Anaerolineae bacterium]
MTTLMATQSPQADEEIRLARQSLTDVSAFAELYRRNVTRVYRYHIAHTGSIKDAEDLTSQTFMAAMEGIRSFRGTGSFAAWIMGIASKKRLMYFRSRGNRHEIPLEAAVHYPSPDLPTDKAAVQRLELESVSRALRHIARDRAEAITLSYFAGLTNSEISHVMNKSEAAVKMLISRGLQDLRERTSLALEAER